MSFSEEIKNEVAKTEIDSTKDSIAELSAFVRTCSVLCNDNDSLTLNFITENASVARRIYTLCKNFSNKIDAEYEKDEFRKRANFIIKMYDEYGILDLLYDTSFFKRGDEMVFNYKSDSHSVYDYGTEKSYIRAAFLGAGSISNPNKSYHLEIVSKNADFVEDLNEKLSTKNFNSRISNRKSTYIVYIKEAERISDFLAYIGANRGVLKFENIRALKDLRNNVNRVVNFETANISKTISASMKQIEDINFIIESDKFNILSDSEKEVARLRLENPESSLKDIVEISNDKFTKSGINYRLKKISSFAEKLRGAK